MFSHPITTIGFVVSAGGWFFLVAGTEGGSVAGHDIVSLHKISLAENIILLGYVMVVAGMIAQGFARLKGQPTEEISTAGNTKTAPTRNYDPARFEKDISERKAALKEGLKRD